jgi:signal transduction histidine kinase
MTSQLQTLIGVSAFLFALLGIVVLAVFRFRSAAKRMNQSADVDSAESAFVAAAMAEAVSRIRTKEQAQQVRADESERLSEDIVSGLTSGLMVVSADGGARIVNPAARRLLNLPTAFAPTRVAAATAAAAAAAAGAAGTAGNAGSAGAGGGAGLANMMRTPSYAEVLISVPPLAAVIEETLRTRQPIMRRVIDLRAHGLRTSAAQLGVTVSPIVHFDGRFQGLICLFTDLSTVVQLEEQLRLRESLAQVGEMTAGIAHEFRNSLATIHGYARLIDLGALSERDRTCVVGIQQEANALGEVVTNFLHFARPVDVSMEVIDLRSVLERAMDDVRAEVAARGGSLDLTGPGVRVEGDEVLLRQAFGNLCRNAVEACAEHGIVPAIHVEVRVNREHRQTLITVADNGPGVQPAARDRMFQPFFTTKAKGTGLGLALVQKIIVIHNGRITPSHPERGGLRMEVALPLVESAVHSATH